MAKDHFNSVSSRQNSKTPSAHSSGFLGAAPDKRGKVIKTEEDFATAEHRLADGRKVRYRAGKPIYTEPLPEKQHAQEQKKVALTQNEDSRSRNVKREIERKAKDFRL